MSKSLAQIAKELGLTEKMKIFSEEYVIDFNASRAARAAGYSEKTSGEMGYENLNKPQIQEYIAHLRKNTEELLGISRQKVANEYAKLAFSNVADMYQDWMRREEFEKLSDDVKACIAEIYTRVRKVPISVISEEAGTTEVDQEIEEVKIKFHDKQKALEALRKMFGYDQPETIHNINHEGGSTRKGPPKFNFK